MATKPVWTRGGLALECSVSELPRRRPSSAYAIPEVLPAGDSLLSLALETVPGSGRKGIRVTSQALPTSPTLSWSLEHFAFQGTRPAAPTWETLQGFTNPVNLLVTDAMPSATHVFRLVRSEAGQGKAMPEKTITTPADATYADLQAILSDDVISKAEKPLWNTLIQQLQAGAATDRASAVEWAVDPAALDAATAALQNHLAGLTPLLTDLTQDTPLGTGGGATLQAKITAVVDARRALVAQVEAARKAGLDAQLSDDKLSPGERRNVKRERDRIQAVKTEMAALCATNPPATYASWTSAVTALEAALDALAAWDPATHDWDSYSGTVTLPAGKGADLWAKFMACDTAEASLRKDLGLTTADILAGLSNDNVLTVVEKKALVAWYGEATMEQARLGTQATAYGVSRDPMDAAFTQFLLWVQALPAPAWNSFTGPTALGTGGGGTLRTKRQNVIDAMAALAASLNDYIQARASAAQALSQSGLNLIPNPTSELGTAIPEEYRQRAAFDPTKAHAGGWCRVLNGYEELTWHVNGGFPCVPGDTYHYEVWARNTLGTYPLTLKAVWLDGSGGVLQTDTCEVSTTTVYGRKTMTLADNQPLKAPAGAVWCRLGAVAPYLYGYQMLIDNAYAAKRLAIGQLVADIMQTSNYEEDAYGNATAGFKASVGEAEPAKFGPQGLRCGKVSVGEAMFRALGGILSSGIYSSNPYLTWKGNDDPSTRGGAPRLDNCNVATQTCVVVGSVAFFSLEMWIVPEFLTDNLDAIRGITIELLSSDGQGVIGIFHTGGGGRGYYAPENPGSTLNWVHRSAMFTILASLVEGGQVSPNVLVRVWVSNGISRSAKIFQRVIGTNAWTLWSGSQPNPDQGGGSLPGSSVGGGGSSLRAALFNLDV